MWNEAFDQKKGATYRVSRAVEGEDFSALLFEPGQSWKNISPRRNPNRVHRIGVHDISHREVGQGSMRIAVDRVLVPNLSNSPENGSRQNIRENICDRV